MHDLYNLDSTANISQPPVPLGVLNSVTPKAIKTALIDEQTDKIRYDGDVFAFTLATQFAGKAYQYADELRAAGKKVIMGGIHVTVRPEEAMRHADAVVTGEAETLWPTVCTDLLAGTLKERYTGSPTPPSRMVPTDYRFFGERPYLTPASLFATRGCNHRCSFCVSSRFMGPFRTKPLDVLEREIDQLQKLYPAAYLQFTDDNLLADRGHAAEVLALLRRKKRRFVTMVTLDQLCDGALMQEMAYSGCLGVAVGVESVDDDNCLSVGKRQNVSQPFPEAVSRANELGIQVGARPPHGGPPSRHTGKAHTNPTLPGRGSVRTVRPAHSAHLPGFPALRPHALQRQRDGRLVAGKRTRTDQLFSSRPPARALQAPLLQPDAASAVDAETHE